MDIMLIQETKKKSRKSLHVKELYISLSKEPKNVVFWRPENCVSKQLRFLVCKELRF